LIFDFFTDPFSFLFWIIALVIAVDIHEFSHALVADKLGDPTPRINDRLTLNPLAHLDPIGALALLFFHVGWGKPVPIDPFNLKSPQRDSALISLAGPLSNLIMAGFVAILLRLPFLSNLPLLPPFLITLLILSVGLAVFNLIPVPPLDGSKILLGILPKNQAYELEESFSQYGIIFLIFILMPIFNGQSLVSQIIIPIINLIINLLLPAYLFLPAT
jgi:Zn-dependent protease